MSWRLEKWNVISFTWWYLNIAITTQYNSYGITIERDYILMILLKLVGKGVISLNFQTLLAEISNNTNQRDRTCLKSCQGWKGICKHTGILLGFSVWATVGTRGSVQ